MIKNNIKNNKGFVILFAVVLSSIILAVALNIVDILLKEVKFSASARDTNNAFFAADTGAECALFNDKSSGNSFLVEGGSGVVNCLDKNIPVVCLDNNSVPFVGSCHYWSFPIFGLNSGEKGCATVTVDKRIFPTTVIISKGYNNGGTNLNFCTPDSNSVERVLELNY
ncbi:MAG: hypothetical protein WC839_02790 [Candidatus Paceibacterota bacterium]